jgi:hypothetical protein
MRVQASTYERHCAVVFGLKEQSLQVFGREDLEHPLLGALRGERQGFGQVAFGVEPREKRVERLQVGVAGGRRQSALTQSHDELLQARFV